jgi:hypothetical protein
MGMGANIPIPRQTIPSLRPGRPPRKATAAGPQLCLFPSLDRLRLLFPFTDSYSGLGRFFSYHSGDLASTRWMIPRLLIHLFDGFGSWAGGLVVFGRIWKEGRWGAVDGYGTCMPGGTDEG